MGHHEKDSRQDLIAAIATGAGPGGIGVVRVSGRHIDAIARAVLGEVPTARVATFRAFHDASGNIIDAGIALLFRAPASYTGEDVLELQGHGGTVVLGLLLDAVCAAGAREAEPGEFSRRAFLNGRMDLAQAEAVADLIEASTAQAARAAARTLEGHFSSQIVTIDTGLAELRAYVEAAIDFVDEEIDFLSDSSVGSRLEQLLDAVNALTEAARRGSLLSEGVRVVLAGDPNVGKSSLFNRLAGENIAIVTEVPGTTRDLIRQSVNLDGYPLHLVDTAGLRDTVDIVESEGVSRARAAIATADVIIHVVDDGTDSRLANELELAPDLQGVPLVIVRNKIDVSGSTAAVELRQDVPGRAQPVPEIRLSVRTGDGFQLLAETLKTLLGIRPDHHGDFSAKRRHITALNEVSACLATALETFQRSHGGELLAEDLRHAQHALAQIVGERDNEELLGLIFSKFCIGK